VLSRPGFALDDTSLVVYFDAVEPGVSDWASWFVTVFDPDNGAAQESRTLSRTDAIRCGVPRQFCRSFGVDDGWALVGDHGYFVTITVTLNNGTQVVSPPSAVSKARTTTTPPPLPAAQAAGCTCGNVLFPSTGGQAVRGSGVNTGTGAFTLSSVELRMAGFGVPFQAVRTYSSANTSAGSLGLGWSWTYDVQVIPPAGGETAVTVRAEDGARVVYQRAADGSFTRPAGVRSTLSAVDGGWRLVTPDQTTLSFDSTGRLTSVRDRRGFGTTVAYTARLWTVTDAAGRVVKVDLGTDGLVRRITLPDGRYTAYQYKDGRLVAATDAEGAVTTYGYDGTLLAKVVDAQQRTQVTNVYAAGRVIRQVDVLNAVTTFTWDAGAQEAKTIDPDGVVYFDGYRGNVLIYSQNGNGDTVNQRYTPGIEPNLMVDAQGNQLASAFDNAGNLTSTTAPGPFSYTVASTYDARNNLTSRTDGLGHTASFGYDSFGQLDAIVDPAGGRTELRTDGRGLVTAQVDPRGKVTTMAYDTDGNLVSRTTPLGEKTTFGYDRTGRPVATTDPRGNLPGGPPADFTTRFVYDNLDRLRKTFEPGKQRPSEIVYDPLGQVVKTSDPLGNTATYSYTKVIGRVQSVADPNGNATSYTYTKAGRQLSVSNPAGEKTTFAYDNGATSPGWCPHGGT